MRASLCILLVVASALFAVPSSQTDRPATSGVTSFFNPYHSDPNGTLYAFNSTVSDLDLYTNASATTTIGGNVGNVTWYSAINNTVNGRPVNGTGFHFNMAGPNLRETVNYTLTIPRGAGPSTFIRFQWNGTVGPGTSARYIISNSTSSTNSNPTKIVTSTIRPSSLTGTFFGSNSSSSTGGLPLSCNPTNECFDITRFVGFNVTLTFLFNSTSTASTTTGRLRVSVSNVEVASDGPLTQAVSHSLSVNTNDPTEIDHNGRLLVSYNSTVTFPRPNTSTQLVVHKWRTLLLSFYIPNTYRSDNLTLVTTQIDNSTTFYPTHGFVQGPCTTQGIIECTTSIFFSVNATGFQEGNNRNVFVFARSTNSLTSIRTGLGAADTDSWIPGDNMTVTVVNSPGVKISGTQIAVLAPSSSQSGAIPLNITLSTSAPVGSANYTIAIPSSVLPLGGWILTLTFANGFDYGSKTHLITIDEIRVDPGFSASGGVGTGTTINLSGKLSYNSSASLPVRYGNVTIFAIGPGTQTSLLTNAAPPASGLYISNITTVEGVGSPQHPIIMYFSLVNPNASIMYDANITIDHEWYTPGATHGVNVTIQLTPAVIDNGNNFLNPVTYSVQALLTANGVELTLQSLTTNAQRTVMMTPGAGESAVPFLRQHFGYFRITLHAKRHASPFTLETPLPSLESPPYAYLLYTSLLPSQLLAYSPTIMTAADGSFSTAITSNHLLGVSKLRLIVLARDGNGITLGDGTKNPTVFSDSSVLQPTADAPSSAAVQQTVDATLHLKSNSSSLATTLTVNLDITGPSGLPTKTSSVTIQPGTTADVKFTFTAPSSAGIYTMTFSSPQYGGTGSPLLAKTLVVSLVSSSLQIIIPAAIGLVAAVIIAAIYTRRRQPTSETEVSEKTKTKTTTSSKPKPDA